MWNIIAKIRSVASVCMYVSFFYFYPERDLRLKVAGSIFENILK